MTRSPTASNRLLRATPHCTAFFGLILAASAIHAAQGDRDHYSQGWYGNKGAAYAASTSFYFAKWGAAGACATFSELAPELKKVTPYETRTRYIWDIDNNGSCPADGHLYVHEVICQNGATFDGNGGCTPPWNGNPRNEGQQPLMCETGSNPINTATGNKYQREVDYAGTAQGHLRFERHYNSVSMTPGELGVGWTHTYARSIIVNAVAPGTQSPVALVERPDGKVYKFTYNGSAWTAAPDVVGTLTHSGTLSNLPCASGGMVYTNEDDEAETYDNDCRLTKISTRWGFEKVLTRDLSLASGGDGNPLTLDRVNTRYIVSGGATQAIRFVRDGTGRISQLVIPGGAITQFNYDGQSRLISVNYPAPVGTTTRTYHYENPAYPHALTGITDENGQRYATWTYDAQGRAYISEHAGGADRVQFTFNSNGTTGVQSPLGQQQTHHIGVQYDLGKLTQVTGGPCTGCGALTATQTYDTNGFADVNTDFNGNQTDLDLNARGLETQRVEGKGTAEERKIVTSWHATWRLPTQVDVYNAAGQHLRRTLTTYTTLGQVMTVTEQDMQDPNPAGSARTTTYTYFTSGIRKGFVQQVDGPRTDVVDTTTFGYSTTTGNLLTVTNAAGQVITANAYDNHGRLTQSTDANGAVTSYVYHPRGWLTSRTVDGQQTLFAYDNVGQLDRLTLSTGAWIDYDYDAAHRLTDVRDNLGNLIHYDLDLAGNRIGEQVKDPGAASSAKSTAFTTA